MPEVFIHPGGGAFGERCAAILADAGFRATGDPTQAALAVAPRLTRRLPEYEWSAPALGTLVFHPSILPYHRGPDAIRWALQLGEKVSGVTWFWCDSGLDTGPICEQEPLVLRIGESPGHAYHTRFVPAGLRALDRAVAGIAAGNARRIAQEAGNGSYESFYPAAATRAAS